MTAGTLGATCLTFALCVIGTTTAPADKKWRAPRTEHRQPNHQGVWDIGTTTPFQRSSDLSQKRAYTQEEAEAVRKKSRLGNEKMDAPVDLTQGAAKAGDVVGQEADMISFERRDDLTVVNGEIRTSLVI